MAHTAAEFLTALKALRSTGEPQKIGTFTLSNERDGVRTVQVIKQRDWFTHESVLVPRFGGLRYWPHNGAALQRFADSLARQDITELTRRAAA